DVNNGANNNGAVYSSNTASSDETNGESVNDAGSDMFAKGVNDDHSVNKGGNDNLAVNDGSSASNQISSGSSKNHYGLYSPEAIPEFVDFLKQTSNEMEESSGILEMFKPRIQRQKKENFTEFSSRFKEFNFRYKIPLTHWQQLPYRIVTATLKCKQQYPQDYADFRQMNEPSERLYAVKYLKAGQLQQQSLA
ncbi:hypothetical protein FF38_03628, partial [Lucilia cuprina]